jgi:hypothetical protein
MLLASAALVGTSTPLATLLLGGGVDPWLLGPAPPGITAIALAAAGPAAAWGDPGQTAN